MIIELDTRNQKDGYVTKYFDKVGVKWIRNKLYCGDVKLLNDTKVIIDLKKDLLEMCGNLTKSSEHARILREIERAKEIGCERFIFLIRDKDIKELKDVVRWWSKYTKVKGVTLMKIMYTMQKKYGVEFIFTTRLDAGKKILEILEV